MMRWNWITYETKTTPRRQFGSGKVAAYRHLVFLRKLHRGDSYSWCQASIPMRRSYEWIGFG